MIENSSITLRTSALLVFATVAVAAPAVAQPSATDKNLAQSLFERGKAQMESGNYEAACTALAESQRLDPGGGTLLNLALCHERQGKVATAWTEFKEALSAAKRDGRQARVLAAQEHIAALEPRLPWLTLNVPRAAEGQRVLLDGAPLGAAAWGSPIAVDPGAHEVKATATGRKEWSASLSIAIAETKALTIPSLEAAPATEAAADGDPSASPGAAASTGAASDTAPSNGARRGNSGTLGWVVGGAGVALLGAGSYFGIRTLSKKKASDVHCPTDTTCDDEGVKLNRDAASSAWLANVGIGLGIVGVGIGTYLLVRASGDDEARSAVSRSSLALDARVFPGGGGLDLSGRSRWRITKEVSARGGAWGPSRLRPCSRVASG